MLRWFWVLGAVTELGGQRSWYGVWLTCGGRGGGYLGGVLLRAINVSGQSTAISRCGPAGGNAKCYRYIIDKAEMSTISLTYRYLDSPTASSAFPDQSPLNHRNACDNVAAAAVQVAAV